MSDRRQNRFWLLVLSAALALVGLVGTPARAQVIPDGVRTKDQQLSAEEAAQVSQYVADNSKNLMGSDPLALKKDRDALLAPLAKSGTSVVFRLAYDKALFDSVKGMVGSGTEMTVINGLNLAGELATDKELDVVVSKLAAKEAAVRFQAGYALSRTFQAVKNSQQAIGKEKLSDALKSLRAQIAQEKDATVLDSLIRAGLAAADVASVQGAAISAVATGTVQSAKGMGMPGEVRDAEALLRAVVGARDTIGQAVGSRAAFDTQAAKDAAEMSGVLLARICKMIEKNGLTPGPSKLRDACAQIAAAAQATIQFSGQALQAGGTFTIAGPDGKPIQLNDSLKLGTVQGDAAFVADANRLIGVDGMLTKPPFDFSPDKFK